MNSLSTQYFSRVGLPPLSSEADTSMTPPFDAGPFEQQPFDPLFDKQALDMNDWDFLNNENSISTDPSCLFDEIETRPTSFGHCPPPLSELPVVQLQLEKIELLFLANNKQFSSSFASTVAFIWADLASVHYSESDDVLEKKTEKKIELLVNSIDKGEIPSSGTLRKSYQLNIKEVALAEALKNFVRSLIPALMDYYKSNYKGRLEFEANDVLYLLSPKKHSITVSCYVPGCSIPKPFLTMNKP